MISIVLCNRSTCESLEIVVAMPRVDVSDLRAVGMSCPVGTENGEALHTILKFRIRRALSLVDTNTNGCDTGCDLQGKIFLSSQKMTDLMALATQAEG